MKKTRTLKQYAGGGTAAGSTAGQGWMSLFNLIPQIMGGVEDLIDNNPHNASRQPIVNMNTARNMASPYAYGGDVGEDEDTMARLQQMADENGITVDELIAQIQGQQTEMDNGSANVDEEETNDNADEEGQEQFAMGGRAGQVPIEVEGKEVLEDPQGNIAQAKGPSHEEGGIDVAVPNGTKIYSDRLKLDGKSMQQRKLTRERAITRLKKLTEKNPFDKLLQNTLNRTLATTESEDQQDMKIQKAIDTITAPPTKQFKYGGYAMKTFGDEIDEPPTKWVRGADGILRPISVEPYSYKLPKPGKINFTPGNITEDSIIYGDKLPKAKNTNNNVNTIDSNLNILNTKTPKVSTGTSLPTNETLWHNDLEFLSGLNPNNPDYTSLSEDNTSGSPTTPTTATVKNPNSTQKMGLGDYIGMGGNLFNAIAPIMNTKANARATKPNVNRFKAFGKEALDTNMAAEKMAATLKTNQMTDANTSAGSSYARNRNSATGVNTVRALDLATDMAKDKNTGSIQDSFSKEMISILGQRSQLQNQKDEKVMQGQAMRDMEDKADTDNYFSNMGKDLANFGKNIQGLGKNMNVHRKNQVDAKLISQLSRYGLGFDDNGELITVKQ